MSFPDPQTYEFPEWVLHEDYFYHASDIVTFGDELTADSLRDAYSKGIFPWHIEGLPLPWYCPEKRAILEFSDLHIPRRLERERRRSKFAFSIDEDFSRVMELCALVKRPDQGGTWITPNFINAYCELHDRGMAHSVEVWDENGELVGGVYGVDAGGVFCGESMFYKSANASKLALLFLFDHLKSRGATWLDIQVMTPHMRVLGAKEVSRAEFLRKLKETQRAKLKLF